MIDDLTLRRLEVICKINLIAGGVLLVLFAVPFYMLFFTGWGLIPSKELKYSLDQFNFFYLQRISLGTLYVSLGIVVWSGFALLSTRRYAQKLLHLACVMVLYSSVLTFVSYFVDYFRSTEIYSYLKTIKYLGDNFFVSYLLLIIAYAIYVRKLLHKS